MTDVTTAVSVVFMAIQVPGVMKEISLLDS